MEEDKSVGHTGEETPLRFLIAGLDVPAGNDNAVKEFFEDVSGGELTTPNGRVLSLQFVSNQRLEDLVNGVAVTFIDITNQKKSQRALQQQSEEYLRLFMESVKDYAIVTFDTERRVMRWSLGAEAMLGYSDLEIIGRSADVLFVPEDQEKGAPVQEVETAEREGRAESERWHLRKDGSRFWGSSSASPLRDHEGKLLGFVKIMHDLTGQKQKDDAFRQLEEKYRTLFNSVDEGFSILELVFNDAGKVVDYRHRETNRSFEKVPDIQDAVDRHISELTPDLEADWYRMMENVYYTGVPVHTELAVKGANQWYSCQFSRVGGGGSPLIAAVYSNITERKKAEERQAFLLKLSDRLRPLADADAIQETATRTLLEYFVADRCYYCELVNHEAIIRLDAFRAGFASIAGTYSPDSFARFIDNGKAGHPLIVEDVHTSGIVDEDMRAFCTQSRVVSFVTVPVINAGKPVAIFCLGQSSPRVWTALDVELAVEIAERTWIEVERARIAEALHISEQRLHRMINVPKVGVLTFDYSGNLLHANDAFLEMIDYERAEFVEQRFSWRDFTPPGHPINSRQILEQVRQTGKGGPYEKEILRKDGSRLWLMFVGADLNNGTVVEYVVDISDRKRVEEALRKSKEQLRLIIESAKGFAIFTTDANGIVNSWNTGAAAIFGWSEEEIIGQNGSVLFTPEDRAAQQPQIEMDTAASQGIAPDVRWHLRKNGTLVFIDGFSHPVYDAYGKLNGFVKVGRDITAQHNAETALRESEENYRLTLEKEVAKRTAELKEINANLRHANENLQQFASIASHDLQEPLRKIKMFTSVLKKNWSDILPAEGKVVMNKITASSDRMAQLIKEVLEYSKIAYGTREFIRTDLHAILQNVLGDVDLLLEETSAEIDYQEPLPVIDAIHLQMHQLFYNLLTNALKFRKSNTQPKVRIAARFLSATDMQNFSSLAVNTPYIDVTVSDNGIGFNAQFSKQIFQIFERLHSTEEYEGTGVGLALCEKIVENHRGHIYAVSKEGEGASFHVILPVKQ